MSAAPSVLRTLASSSRQGLSSATRLSRRTLIGDTARPTASGVTGSNTSVDPRVLNGVPSFLPKENIDRLCEWQSGLWTRLQSEVRNKPELLEVKQKWDRQGLDVTYLLTQTARDPTLSLAFNYASLLLNNSYFLEGLHGEQEALPVPEYYKTLEEKVVAYAEGMVGSGWLWIVRTEDDNSAVDIFPSFSSGTLLVTNRAQRGRDDVAVFGTPKNSGDVPETAEETEESAEQKNISGLGEGKLRAKPVAKRSTGRPVPLAVLNMFELSYLGGKYGVWSRGEYARDWFRSLDWNKVEKRAASVQ